MFIVPKEYTSFIYLHSIIGDIKTVEYVCGVWNGLEGWKNNSTRIKEINESLAQITITGQCVDEVRLISICKNLVSSHIAIRYQKTYLEINVEI